MKKTHLPPEAAPEQSAQSLLVHPSEVEAFSRRSLLQNGISFASYVSMAQILGMSGTAKAADYPPKRRLVWINMSGGWDVLEVTDPKAVSSENIQMVYGWDQAQALAGAGADDKIGRWMPRLAARGADMVVVRGMSMGTTSHDAGSIYMDTGVLSNAGRVNAASVPSIVASESGATIPVIQLTGGSEPRTDRGLLKPVSVVRAQNLELYRSMYPAAADELARKMAMLDYVKSSVDRVKAEHGDNDRLQAIANANDKIKVQFTNDVGSKLALTTADRAAYAVTPPKNLNTGARDAFALAAKLLKNNLVTCVNLGIGGFDTHASQEQRMAPIMESFDYLLAAFLDDLRASGNLDNTLIVCYSDFGRTPRVNGSSGRDHWPTGGALMLGGGLQGSRIVGATDDKLLSAKVNFTTGKTDNAEDFLSPIHLAGSILALTLGTAYVSYRTYLKDIPALTKLK